MKVKAINNEAEYEQALALAERLMDAVPGSSEADDLEVLSILIEKYEEEHYPMPMPDPISAIKFRMQQQGLTQKDLVPYIGSQPKVSAVLNGKRELSKEMIRKLHAGLGISYEVLMQKPGASLLEPGFSEADYPFTEMLANGYFPGFSKLKLAKCHAEELLENFFAVLSGRNVVPLYLKSDKEAVDENSLLAWQARALHLVQDDHLPKYAPLKMDEEFFTSLLVFSSYEKGPLLVKEHLNKAGIHFIILKHLPQTYLDGASFLANDDRPLVGLTLRQDRLDNFWFTLFHELAHVKLHLSQNTNLAFFDETDGDGEESSSLYELEANDFAREHLVPTLFWETHIKPHLPLLEPSQIMDYSMDLKVNPAILAGRIRYELNDYSAHTELVGYHKVREQFSEYNV